MKLRKLLFVVFVLFPSLMSFKSSNQEIIIEWHALRHFRKVNPDGSVSNEIRNDGLGHSYVIIKNLTSYSINVGYYTLSPNNQVSVGLWTSGALGSSSNSSSSLQKHNGVIYNYERYHYYYLEKPVDDIYAKTTISNSKLNEVSNIIKDKNDTYNAITYNCATFSTELWNKADNKSYWTGWFRAPDNVIADIKGGYQYFSGNYLSPSRSFCIYNNKTSSLETYWA